MVYNDVVIESVENSLELEPIDNSVDTVLFDVLTDRHFLTQFQVNETHKEVKDEY